jgi:hypothetical protein
VLIAGEKLRFGWSHGGYFAVVMCYKRVPHTDNDSGLPNTCSNLKKPRFSSTVSSFTDMMRNYWREQIEFKCIALIDPLKQFTTVVALMLFVRACLLSGAFSCHFKLKRKAKQSKAKRESSTLNRKSPGKHQKPQKRQTNAGPKHNMILSIP